MRNLPQIIRFLLVGGSATSVNWLARFPLSLIMPFPAAVLVAYMIGMLVGFTLYRAYVFPASSLTFGMQVGLFFGVNVAGVVTVISVSLLLLRIIFPAVGFTFLSEALSHGTALAMGAVINFFGHKYLSFRIAHPRMSSEPLKRKCPRSSITVALLIQRGLGGQFPGELFARLTRR